MIREADTQSVVLRFCTEMHRQVAGKKQSSYHSQGVFLTGKCVAFKAVWNYLFLHVFTYSQNFSKIKDVHIFFNFISS